ncbi:MAG: FAD-dependent oxidoreductase [Deltaproteobacteria bacterium]|nr:FAD-dependent oxidoreductase [Deltaproteobacteria bacterium]
MSSSLADSLRPENLLRSGYKDCVLCEVLRPGEEERCRDCSGRLGQRDRLLWEIRREQVRKTAGALSLVYPGLGHLYSGRTLYGIFWAALLPLSLGLVLNLGSGINIGHGVLLLEAGMVWWMAFVDARRGPRETVAPCEAACPAHIRVPDYIALVREGRPLEALALVHDKLPFAAFCGRACPHPCEQECVRNEWGAPISIMAIKRYAADIGYAAGVLPPSGIEEGVPRPRVAVFGAGASGLSAADTLARLGASVTVFDPNEEPGGMMRYGAAEFRFPAEGVRADVSPILARGVHFRGGVAFDRDATFSSLEKEGFDAVLIAVGCSEALRLPGAGGERQGFHDALSFLLRVRDRRLPRLHGRVAVIGGGNVAIDAARSALRMGASDVTIACVESREAMPAFPWEIEAAVSEGATLLTNTAVGRFHLRGGVVTAFEALKVERVDIDAGGRIVPRTVSGSEFEVPADAVVMAIGTRPDLSFLPGGIRRKAVDRRHHVFRLQFPEREPKIHAYICGDCVRGSGTVVEASASGRAAAMNIYADLCVEEVRKARFRDNYRRRSEPQVSDRPEWRVRRKAERLAPEEARGSFEEVEKRLADRCAREESERCARCNLSL